MAGGLAFADGALYLTDYGSVREVDARTDVLTTPVGPLLSDNSRLGGLATSFFLTASGRILADRAGNLLLSAPGRLLVAARSTGTFYGHPMVRGHIYAIARLPQGAAALAVDAHGNFVLADPADNKILVLARRSGVFYGRAMTAWRAYTVAGTGAAGRTGDGGPALKARLYAPESVAADHNGNLVIADTFNSRIRVVAARTGRFYGQPMRKGDIYTLVNRNGAWFNGGFGGDGGPALQARINRPSDVVIDRSGNVLIADTRNGRVRVVAARSGSFYGKAMIAGRIYTVAGSGQLEPTGDGIPAVDASILPGSITTDGLGNLVISDDGQVVVVAAGNGDFYGQPMKQGDIYAAAGASAPAPPLMQDGWLAPRVQLSGGEQPGICVDGYGNIIAADWNSHEVFVIAGRTGTFYGRPMIRGRYYLIVGAGDLSQPGNGGPALTAGINPYGVAVDHSGNIIVTDVWNDLVRVIANNSGTFFGQPMTAGNIYAIAGGGPGSPGSGDGGPATQAVLRIPAQVSVDSAGNVIFADGADSRIRVVAASTGLYYGQQMTAGDIYTIAGTGTEGTSPDGTVATRARLNQAAGVAVDSFGNVVIAEAGDELIRVVATQPGRYYGRAMLAGRIYTIAGGGTAGIGDGGPAVKARLDIGLSILVDAHGNIVIPGGHRVRVVASGNGTFYGVPMIAGDIYTVAGVGTTGWSGDGGPAVKAVLEDPQSAAVDSIGDLVIGDGPRIRQVDH